MSVSNTLTRRSAISLLAAPAAASLLQAAHAQAQAWPTRPIKLLVPFAAGGSNDILARALAAKLSSRLGQPIVIDNKGGGGGTIGTDTVAKSAPDGYTLLVASTSISTNAASGKKLPYNLEQDLQPIGLLGSTPLLIVASNESKIKNLRDLLDQARARPAAISYGSPGIGGINHFGMELLASEARVRFTHIPYKGIAPAFTDLLGGNLPVIITSLASATQHISSGRVRAIAVTTEQRSVFLPQVPTVSESGLSGFKLESWWGLLAPAKTPPEVIKRLNAELNWAVGQQDFQDLLAKEGATPRPGMPEDFGKLIAMEVNRWNGLVKSANIQLE
ncbi:MAG: tripartite tricarboxylate transporter substrate binding protein [Pseudomonadota bacterium]